MVQVTQRVALGGPALVRLLARLTDVEMTESGQSLSDRLSQWLHWTDAITLSTALGGTPLGGMASLRPVETQDQRCPEEKECAATRNTLTNEILTDSVFGTSIKRPGAREPHLETVTEFQVFRQRCLTLQQSMETSIGNLRGRLRARLAARTPAMKRLAEVDAVMEHALGPRERTLLGHVPVLLGRHFEQLRRSEHNTSGAWLDIFRQDSQNVLLAELDLRFQPVEGLLAALRTR